MVVIRFIKSREVIVICVVVVAFYVAVFMEIGESGVGVAVCVVGWGIFRGIGTVF